MQTGDELTLLKFLFRNFCKGPRQTASVKRTKEESQGALGSYQEQSVSHGVSQTKSRRFF